LGVVLDYRKHGFPQGLLAERSARLVVSRVCRRRPTDGAAEHGVRGLERSILRFAGMVPARETLLGMVDATSGAKRQGWLARMRDCGRRLI
jgi:putative NADPH-quinone reductase